MGILDKVMFWKKKDDFADLGLGSNKDMAFGDDFGMDQGMAQQQPGLGQQPDMGFSNPSMPSSPSMPPAPQMQPPSAAQFGQAPRYDSPQQDMTSKNIEVISSKIDALRANLESINQRLANLEAIARGEQDKRKRYY